MVNTVIQNTAIHDAKRFHPDIEQPGDAGAPLTREIHPKVGRLGLGRDVAPLSFEESATRIGQLYFQSEDVKKLTPYRDQAVAKMALSVEEANDRLDHCLNALEYIAQYLEEAGESNIETLIWDIQRLRLVEDIQERRINLVMTQAVGKAIVHDLQKQLEWLNSKTILAMNLVTAGLHIAGITHVVCEPLKGFSAISEGFAKAGEIGSGIPKNLKDANSTDRQLRIEKAKRLERKDDETDSAAKRRQDEAKQSIERIETARREAFREIFKNT